MGFWHRVDFALFPLSTVEELIQAWNPKGCEMEKEYEHALATFLRDSLGSVPVVQGWARGRARVDIVVDEKVARTTSNSVVGFVEGSGRFQRAVDICNP